MTKESGYEVYGNLIILVFGQSEISIIWPIGDL